MRHHDLASVFGRVSSAKTINKTKTQLAREKKPAGSEGTARRAHWVKVLTTAAQTKMDAGGNRK
jgi:hypothetical protein